MKETYKGYDIIYIDDEQEFHFTISNTPLRVYTLKQAQETIDNYLSAQKLIGKKVIGFSSADGYKVIATITSLQFDEYLRLHSSPVTLWFLDENGKRLPTLGPFMEYNEENLLLANEFLASKERERLNREEAEKVWNKIREKRLVQNQ